MTACSTSIRSATSSKAVSAVAPATTISSRPCWTLPKSIARRTPSRASKERHAMYATTYHKPKTLAEAVELYANSDEPSYLSGGHTLIPTLKSRLAAPAHLIDVRNIPELSGIE